MDVISVIIVIFYFLWVGFYFDCGGGGKVVEGRVNIRWGEVGWVNLGSGRGQRMGEGWKGGEGGNM